QIQLSLISLHRSLPKYERLLPQWLTGLIAVSGFLLLTFIAFVVKKVWCEKSTGGGTASGKVKRSNVRRTHIQALASLAFLSLHLSACRL
uniref:Uncharacterized protein n=1 Tax=Oryzias sinensis TaxID=183150 RepID=A0A8C7WTS9_9TELE